MRQSHSRLIAFRWTTAGVKHAAVVIVATLHRLLLCIKQCDAAFYVVLAVTRNQGCAFISVNDVECALLATLRFAVRRCPLLRNSLRLLTDGSANRTGFRVTHDCTVSVHPVHNFCWLGSNAGRSGNGYARLPSLAALRVLPRRAAAFCVNWRHAHKYSGEKHQPIQTVSQVGHRC